MQSNNEELQPAVKINLMANSNHKIQGFSLASNKFINSIKGSNSIGGLAPETSSKSKKTYLIVNHSSHNSLITQNRQSNHKESSDLIKRILRA
jgi:hypothetical protein